MIILKINPRNQKAAVKAAVSVLRRGGVIALPTETTYGLACDPRKPKAVAMIFRIKGRDETKPLQLIAGSMPQVKRFASLNKSEKAIASRHWPGPLTLLVGLRAGQTLAPRVNPKKVIGVRVTPSEIAAGIALALGCPVAATSANRSGSTPAFSGKGVVKAFQGFKYRPDLVLDFGSLPRRKPSTVARIKEDGSIEILRRGAVRLGLTSGPRKRKN